MELTLREDLDPRRAGNVAKVAAIGVLFTVTYFPTLALLHQKYSEVDSYYSHGYLIPLISAVVVWHKRRTLADMPVTPSPAGLVVLAAGLLLHLFGTWWYVNFASSLSMLIVLTGLSLSVFGRAVTRELVFPLVYLLFMIPLPKIAIIYITFWLKLTVASAAAEAVGAMGVPVLLEGAFVELPGARLEIDNACSGLRSLIALTALGVVWAYFLPVSGPKKWAIVLLSVPIALGANLTRIVTLILISYVYGSTGRAFEITDFATGFLIFGVAAGGLFAASRAVLAFERRWPSRPALP